jgi:hypothetical protein
MNWTKNFALTPALSQERSGFQYGLRGSVALPTISLGRY